MNYYLRQPGSIGIEGPESGEVLTSWLEQGKVHPDSEVHEEQGQTEVTLRHSVDWQPLASLAGEESGQTPSLNPTDARLEISKALRQRYATGYAAAEVLHSVGFAVKWIGSVLLGLLLIGSITSGSAASGGGFLVHCLLGSPCILLGFVLSAMARIYTAMLDSAVNSSRHLTDGEVAQLLVRNQRE